MSERILILGVSGMLGNTCFEHFSHFGNFETIGTWRGSESKKIKTFDVLTHSISELISDVNPSWIINCIGIIRQKIVNFDQVSIDNTFSVNRVFPFELASAVSNSGIKVLQIATDCVFNGEIGGYTESFPHNAQDIYGISKSQGEVSSKEFMNLRTSIIGREIAGNFSLIEWFLSQEYGSKVDGYVNHLWNGVTTLAFSRIARGIIQGDNFIPGTFHVIPRNYLSKYDLLYLFRNYFDRKDLVIKSVKSSNPINRILKTNYPDQNEIFWRSAGYPEIPSIEDLIRELSAYC